MSVSNVSVCVLCSFHFPSNSIRSISIDIATNPKVEVEQESDGQRGGENDKNNRERKRKKRRNNNGELYNSRKQYFFALCVVVKNGKYM